MATAKTSIKVSAGVDLPECPVCLESMTVPIFQCSTGHSLCSSCTRNLLPAICPVCRQPMTQMRNWQLEEIVQKAKMACPNKSAGCIYTMLAFEVEEHLKECIYRQMDCPLGAVFGRCSWNGMLKEMMDHFKERHPTHCSISSDAEVELNNIDVNEDERLVYLVTVGKIHFIITMKIDTLQKVAYWAVQLIGGKKIAHQHIYEIHVISKQDNRRKAVFTEHCFNDALKADEVFRLSKCAVLPLNSLKHFISNKKLSFRFFIKRAPGVSKDDKAKGNNTGNSGPGNKNTGPNMTGPKKGTFPDGPGPKGPWPKGPGPKGPGPKGQAPKKQNKVNN